MPCVAKIFLQPAGETLALSIGTRTLAPRVAPGKRVRFAHDGRIIDGLVRTIDPTDWERRGVVPAVVVKTGLSD
jgi:hypothetical protein